MDEMEKGKIETIKKKWCSIVSTSTSLASATQGKKKEGGKRVFTSDLHNFPDLMDLAVTR